MERLADEIESGDEQPDSSFNFARPSLKRSAIDFSVLRTWAQEQYAARRRRGRFFDPDLFKEPTWDLLLDLFICRTEGRAISVTSACLASGVPSTTALRWLAVLEKRGLIERKASPEDQRVSYIRLTETGFRQMTDYVLDLNGFDGLTPLSWINLEGGTLKTDAVADCMAVESPMECQRSSRL